MTDNHDEIAKPEEVRKVAEKMPRKAQAGRGPFGRGRRGFGESERGSVKYDILGILWDGQRHDYDIMLTIEEQRGHRPSPGSIYPALQMLEEGDFLTGKEIDGNLHAPGSALGRGRALIRLYRYESFRRVRIARRTMHDDTDVAKAPVHVRRRLALTRPIFIFAGVAYLIAGVAKYVLHQEYALIFALCGLGFLAVAYFAKPGPKTPAESAAPGEATEPVHTEPA